MDPIYPSEFESICASNLAVKDELSSPGFRYDLEGTGSNTHIEFHVDDHSPFMATLRWQIVGTQSKL
jgi:hypothetical protein